MFPHLPEAIFWDVIKRTDDVKACVALWSSQQELFTRFSAQEFWRNMCYYHFNFSSNPYHLQWCDVYWWLYRNMKGCGYCNRTIAPPKDGFMIGKKIDVNQFMINIDNKLNIYVCQRCKNTLGDNVVHRSQIDPWKISLMRRLRGHRCSSMFTNYFGEKQIERCHSFNMKCAECLKNVKNVRCPHNMCGTCCNCKYHKSHYNQATPGDMIVSFDVYALINLDNDQGHGNRKKKTNRNKNRRALIVHKF